MSKEQIKLLFLKNTFKILLNESLSSSGILLFQEHVQKSFEDFHILRMISEHFLEKVKYQKFLSLYFLEGFYIFKSSIQEEF